MLLRSFYRIKRFIPRKLQIQLRRMIVARKRAQCSDVWPIDARAGNPPEGWAGWPDGKKFALVLTHDVESAKGIPRCLPLADIEEKLGFHSSFNFLAEDYVTPPELIDNLRNRGFEIGLHGLSHEGNLFRSRRFFSKKVRRINQYLKDWGVSGFRSPSMYRNLEWIGDLDLEYDSSTFDTDPFEPQPDGVGTIFPVWVGKDGKEKGYVELPYTLPQDHTLFVIMGEKDISIWKRKLDWIAAKGGLALVITHPDYMHFSAGTLALEEYPSRFYEELLEYAKANYGRQYWHVLPKEMASFRIKVFSKNRYPQEGSVDENRKAETSAVRRHLRVAMLSYSFYETDARVSRYAETLVRRGDHVDVIAIGREDAESYATINGVHVYRVQQRERNEQRRITYLSRVLKFLMKSSVFLSKKHRKQSYDLIHVHSVPDFEVFSAWLPKLMGAKVILDIHDIVPEFYTSKFDKRNGGLAFKALAAMEKASAAFSDHVIISNHIWEEKVLARSVSREKCTVILNYPDPQIFFQRPRDRSDGRFIMLYPGTLNRHQGLDIAIKAFGMIRNEAPEADFQIYGGGSEKENLQRLSVELGIQNRVFFKNSIPVDQIAVVMSNSDLGIIPKRNDPFGGEAFSTKSLEFMSLGVPVIMSETKIDRHYFNDSVVKFFEPDNVNALAEAMLELIRSESMRKTLAENALKFVQDFSWEKRKHEYLSLVDRLTTSQKT